MKLIIHTSEVDAVCSSFRLVSHLNNAFLYLHRVKRHIEGMLDPLDVDHYQWAR